MAASPELPPTPPEVRRRIKGKMAAPVAYQVAYLLVNNTISGEKMYLVNKQNEERYINTRRANMRANGDGNLYYKLRRDIRMEWLTKTHEQKAAWLTSMQLAQEALLVAETVPWMLAEFRGDRMTAGLRKVLEIAPACLFTFNNGWLLDQEDWCALVRQLQDCPAELELQARRREDTMALFDRFCKQTDCFAKWAGWQHWSVALEISLESESLGRVHLHAFAHFKEANFQLARKTLRYGFDNTVPNRVWCKGIRGAGGRDKAIRNGHYYLQAPKIGQICMQTTWPKFTKMMVNCSAVKELWRKRKISTRDAKVEVVQCRDRTPGCLREIEDTMQAEYRINADAAWKKQCKGWGDSTAKEPSIVELQWMEQFRFKCSSSSLRLTPAAVALEAVPQAMEVCRQRRFKLLIYDGPSGFGKTERAARWFGSDKTLTIQCKDISSPNLRDWQCGDFESMVFDEGNWELVSSNRALFQAGPRPIQMAQSQCNDRCYTLHVDACPMIVTSNEFWKGCNDWGAYEWITQNSVYIYIDCKQYIMN
jgi:hypothetical protein